MCFTNGGLGKVFAPLQNTGLDPVGKATNKALGFVDKKQEQVAVAAVKDVTTPLSTAIEQQRKLAQGTVLESGGTGAGSVLSSGKIA